MNLKIPFPYISLISCKRDKMMSNMIVFTSPKVSAEMHEETNRQLKKKDDKEIDKINLLSIHFPFSILSNILDKILFFFSYLSYSLTN